VEVEAVGLGSRRSRESFGFDSGVSVCAKAAGGAKSTPKMTMIRIDREFMRNPFWPMQKDFCAAVPKDLDLVLDAEQKSESP
jgi:hypothetical protein